MDTIWTLATWARCFAEALFWSLYCLLFKPQFSIIFQESPEAKPQQVNFDVNNETPVSALAAFHWPCLCQPREHQQLPLSSRPCSSLRIKTALGKAYCQYVVFRKVKLAHPDFRVIWSLCEKINLKMFSACSSEILVYISVSVNKYLVLVYFTLK